MIVRILLLFIALFTFGVQAQAIKESYAFAVLGEPRYAFNFNHFDYVNPAAPKGGQITLSALGTARQPGRTHRAVVRHAIYDFR